MQESAWSLVAFLVSVSAEIKVQNGEGRLVSLSSVTENGIKLIKELAERFNLVAFSPGIGEESQIHLTDDDLREFDAHPKTNITVKTLDLEAMLLAEAQDIEQSNLNRKIGFNLQSYNRFNAIETFLQQLARRNPDVVTLKVLGKSIEGRNMLLVELRLGMGPASVMKPAFAMDCGIHAREWISPATCLNLIDRLIKAGLDGPLGDFDFFVFPVMNPDGYEFTFTNSRFWRKNLRRNHIRQCPGVDLNRNYSPFFGGAGSSGRICSHVYRGRSRLSEPESQAFVLGMDGIIKEKSTDHFPIHLSFHAYGQFLLRPYSVSSKSPPNKEDLDQVAKAGLSVLQGTPWDYTYGSGFDLLYHAAGASTSWVYRRGIPFTYTVELPPKIDGGSFILPTNQIEGVVDHIWTMVGAMSKQLLGLVNGTSTDFAWKFLDLQAMISAELAEIDTLNRASQFNLDSYHRLEEIEAFLSSKSEEFSSIAYVSVIGQGHRGNKISMISLKVTPCAYFSARSTLSHSSNFQLRNSSMTIKPAIWLDCGIHAREWIAPATCLCAVDRLLTQGVEGPLGNFDFFIVPVVNPDGYVHTWTQSRFWRKNRRYISPACSGVDINRNFDPDFGGPSTSKIGCNENYKGKAAFSEPESQALVTTVESIIAEYGLGRFPLYLSLHAYGQFILRPHSDTGDLPSVEGLLNERANTFAQFTKRNGLVLNAAKTQLMGGGNTRART
eukprot:maker-scaffold806_size94461-snap-gene-0.11 protein:Tk02031 transcript:maker-scaffold806_size94461-snap-gene-0.11-mRNA-1 annotation:"unnamed protein product"